MALLKSSMLILAVLIFCAAPIARGDDDRYGLLISIDGFCGRYGADADQYALKIPNLRKLCERGTFTWELRSVLPSLTYPAHATLITGCRPARHGILANHPFEPPTQTPSRRLYWQYQLLRAPTLFDAARSKGWTTAAVSWPVTDRAPLDFLLPEIWDPDHYDERLGYAAKRCHPADLAADVLTRYDLGLGIGADRSLTNIARYVVECHRPRFLALHLVELDMAQHRSGPETPEAFAAAEHCDGFLGEMLELYARLGLLEHTVVAVVSDHGFLPATKRFDVNVLLQRAGLIEEGDSTERKWRIAAWPAGGSCALVLHDPNDHVAVDAACQALKPYTNANGGLIARIIERDELDALEAFPSAALALEASPPFRFGTNADGALIDDTSEGPSPYRGGHGHHPDTGGMSGMMILAGPGIAKGVRLQRVPMEKVAPTVAQLLDLNLDSAEGHVIQQALAPPVGSD